MIGYQFDSSVIGHQDNMLYCKEISDILDMNVNLYSQSVRCFMTKSHKILKP